jgi:hypothetical protein
MSVETRKGVGLPSVRPRDITLGRNSLSAGPLNIGYDAISSIRFEYTVRKHYPQMVTLHHLRFEVFIENNPAPLQIGRSFLGGYGMSEANARAASAMYEELSRRTFRGRLTHYVEQMQHTGGFLYDGKRFLKNGDVLSSGGNAIMNLRDRKLFQFPDRIECRPREGMMSHVARFVPVPGHTIQTRFDRDVFFNLVDVLWGIKWEN